MTESDFQKKVRIELTKNGFTSFRINVMGAYSKDGRYMPPSVPKGFADLIAIKEGRIMFIEVKVGKNKPSKEQINFIERMKGKGCVAGVVWNIDDLLNMMEVFSND